MTEHRPSPSAGSLAGHTAWARSFETPLRVFLRTETGSAAVLVAMAVAALVWINVDAASYETVWQARLSVRLAGAGVSLDLREWVNSGLMTLFFFVFGLEARREFDMGELRERRRLALPLLAGLGGLIVPVAIYLAINTGPAARGWGAAMSTDTAFALGMLALTRPRFPDRVRAFLLSVAVVDDLVSLVVIAAAYSQAIHPVPLVMAVGVPGHRAGSARAGIRAGVIYVLLGVAAWVAVLKSGVDPVVVGLVMGLLTYARPAARTDLERASDLFRSFREQPTAELARSAGSGLAAALSPNERLQLLYHPWTSYVIVPLFALANAGIVLSGSFLARAYASPITLGILIGYVAGKPIGIAGATWLLARLSRGRLRPPVGWAAVAGTGTIAGIGFTVSILIATLAFHGGQLQEAKLGVLSTAVVASAVTWLLFRATALLPARLRIRALLGTSQRHHRPRRTGRPDRDHIRGPARAPVTDRRVRRLRVPVLRPGRARGPRAPRRPRRRPLRLAPPAAHRRAPARRSSPPRPPRPPPTRARSGRCTTCCCATRTPCSCPTCSATPPSPASTPRGSATTSPAAPAPPGSPRTSTPPTSAACPARRRSSSTAAATTAATTSTRCTAAVKTAKAAGAVHAASPPPPDVAR